MKKKMLYMTSKMINVQLIKLQKKLKYKMLKRTTSTFSCKYEVIRDIENCI